MIHVDVAHQSNQSSIAFTPDGRTLATASSDGTVKVWDAQTGGEVRATYSSVNLASAKTDRYTDFADIGHALWALLVACMGGAVAGFLAWKNNDRPMSTATINQARA